MAKIFYVLFIADKRRHAFIALATRWFTHKTERS